MKWEWLGIVAAISGILFSYLGYQRGTKAVTKTEGEKDGSLQTDISYIKSNIDKILDVQKEHNQNVVTLNEKVIRLEERFNMHVQQI